MHLQTQVSLQEILIESIQAKSLLIAVECMVVTVGCSSEVTNMVPGAGSAPPAHDVRAQVVMPCAVTEQPPAQRPAQPAVPEQSAQHQQQNRPIVSKTEALLARLRAQHAHSSVHDATAAPCNAIQDGTTMHGSHASNRQPSMPRSSTMHPSGGSVRQQQLNHVQQCVAKPMRLCQQNSAFTRQPLQPIRNQISQIRAPNVLHAEPPAKKHLQLQQLSRSQQIALERAGLSHSQDSTDVHT
jgi:hypothetical protein